MKTNMDKLKREIDRSAEKFAEGVSTLTSAAINKGKIVGDGVKNLISQVTEPKELTNLKTNLSVWTDLVTQARGDHLEGVYLTEFLCKADPTTIKSVTTDGNFDRNFDLRRKVVCYLAFFKLKEEDPELVIEKLYFKYNELRKSGLKNISPDILMNELKFGPETSSVLERGNIAGSFRYIGENSVGNVMFRIVNISRWDVNEDVPVSGSYCEIKGCPADLLSSKKSPLVMNLNTELPSNDKRMDLIFRYVSMGK